MVEVFAGEGAAVEPEPFLVDVLLPDLVAGLRVESVKPELRNQRAALVEGAVGEQHGLFLVFRHVHHPVVARIVVRRADAVEVALHDDVAVSLVAFDGFAREGLLLGVHLLGLQLHAQTARAGHVEAEFDRRDVAGLVVGRGRDVRAHDRRRVEQAGAVLDAGARKRFGVVAGPHLVEILHGAVLHAAAARSAGLDQHVGIFGADALHDLVESLHIVDPEVRLPVFGQEFRSGVLRMAVGVPFDVVDVGRELHRVVEYREYEVLHLGVGQVQQPLVAHPGHFAVARPDDPVRMFLGQFALGVDHLRLDPDAEFQPFAVCVRSDVVDAFGEFFCVDLPVAESGVRIVARIFVAEPSVVQHEHFQSHVRRVVDHVRQGLGVEREVGALPAVEQRRGVRMAVPYAVVARPVVQVAARAACALEAVGVDHFGRGERFALGERVIRSVGVDSREDVEHVEFIDLEVEPEVAAPCQRAGDHLAVVLVEGFAVERDHEGRVLGVRRAHQLARLDALRAVGEQRVVGLALARP